MGGSNNGIVLKSLVLVSGLKVQLHEIFSIFHNKNKPKDLIFQFMRPIFFYKDIIIFCLMNAAKQHKTIDNHLK